MQQPPGGPYSNPPGGYQPYPGGGNYQSANGVLILVLGILSLIMCGCLAGIPAWIMGNNSLALIRSGRGDPKEEQLVTIGRILGIIGTCLSIVSGVVWFLLVGMAIMSGGGRPG